MSLDWSQHLGRYFDSDNNKLTSEELQSLQQWLASDPQNREQFCEYAFIHDQLRAQLLTHFAVAEPYPTVLRTELTRDRVIHSSPRRHYLSIAAIAATLFALWFIWRGSETALAGQDELQRLIAANAQALERCYLIEVDTNTVGGAKPRNPRGEDTRPPKPPLDQAMLYVRGDHQFVLERRQPDGRIFLTGSDGKTSWMVAPDGMVRRSSNLQRFNHDVPGHEYSMSLCNLHEALTQLQSAYELVASPLEYADNAEWESPATRMLVAAKKRGYPGPRRVEISYVQSNGSIQQIRFVDMPYGPDRLTLRMSLIQHPPLGNDFFEHHFHHAADQPVIDE